MGALSGGNLCRRCHDRNFPPFPTWHFRGNFECRRWSFSIRFQRRDTGFIGLRCTDEWLRHSQCGQLRPRALLTGPKPFRRILSLPPPHSRPQSKKPVNLLPEFRTSTRLRQAAKHGGFVEKGCWEGLWTVGQWSRPSLPLRFDRKEA